jgi:hypothetical protein
MTVQEVSSRGLIGAACRRTTPPMARIERIFAEYESLPCDMKKAAEFWIRSCRASEYTVTDSPIRSE